MDYGSLFAEEDDGPLVTDGVTDGVTDSGPLVDYRPTFTCCHCSRTFRNSGAYRNHESACLRMQERAAECVRMQGSAVHLRLELRAAEGGGVDVGAQLTTRRPAAGIADANGRLANGRLECRNVCGRTFNNGGARTNHEASCVRQQAKAARSFGGMGREDDDASARHTPTAALGGYDGSGSEDDETVLLLEVIDLEAEERAATSESPVNENPDTFATISRRGKEAASYHRFGEKRKLRVKLLPVTTGTSHESVAVPAKESSGIL